VSLTGIIPGVPGNGDGAVTAALRKKTDNGTTAGFGVVLGDRVAAGSLLY